MKCTVTNISAVTQTIFPEAGSESIAAGDKFTGEFSPERIEEMTDRQPGKFAVDVEKIVAHPAATASTPPLKQQHRQTRRGRR